MMRTILLAVVLGGLFFGSLALYAWPPVVCVPIRPASSADIFDAIDYREATGTLTVSFREGYRYEYYRVPPARYLGLTRAGSPGSYFNRQIRGQFACARVAAPRR